VVALALLLFSSSFIIYWVIAIPNKGGLISSQAIIICGDFKFCFWQNDRLISAIASYICYCCLQDVHANFR
jgi:hypothetical protein